jgi:hypothetical protein
VLVAQGHEPGWGPFTLGWFETPTEWQHFIDDHPSLSALLHAIGLRHGLPDTATSALDPTDQPGSTLPLGVTVTAVVGFAVALHRRLATHRTA